MERLELIYKALTSIGFEDLANLPKDKVGEVILQVEDLQNQLKELLNQKSHDQGVFSMPQSSYPTPF